jgi:hypothetical protein
MAILLALGQVIFLEAGFAVVQSAWHNEFIGPAGRIGSIVLVVLVIGLPWVVHPRSVFGPVAADRAARLVRIGGYVLLFLLIPVVLAVLEYDRNQGGGALVVLPLVFVGYGLTILGVTSQRWPIRAKTLAVGGTLGVAVGLAGYALTPFGGTPHVTGPALAAVYYVAISVVALGGPMVAGRVTGQGVVAGLVTGVIAALLVTVFSITTALLYRHRATLSDTAVEYLIVLFLAPGIGALAGACGSAIGRRCEVAMPEPRSGEAPLPLS